MFLHILAIYLRNSDTECTIIWPIAFYMVLAERFVPFSRASRKKALNPERVENAMKQQTQYLVLGIAVVALIIVLIYQFAL